MKLAQIILPIVDNAGKELFFEHGRLKHELMANWGGYTQVHGNGAWKSEADGVIAEPVVVYSIAMPLADVVKFREIARGVAKSARQQCVMIVTPNGDVEFVAPAENKSAQTY